MIKTKEIFFLLSLAIASISGLALSIYLSYTVGSSSIIEVFSYFTIQSNFLVAVVVIASLLNIGKGKKWFNILEFGSLVNITITGIVYTVLLRGVWNPEGLSLITDALLHYVTPILFVVYWLVSKKKYLWGYRLAFVWFLYPLAYFVYTIVRGPIANFYPYPFVDVNELGLQQVVINAFFISIFFFVVSFLLIAYSKTFKK